jgi:LysM repeat protein
VSGGSAPSPTQDGLVSGCNNYALAKSGDDCFDFANSHSIAPTQLYAWNPVLGLNGSDCSTKFWASEYYCVGVLVTATTPVTAPGPTQTGITASCNLYAQAETGDDCDVFASRNSISNAQLYAWNKVLGTTGQNCGTSLLAQEWYCVGIAASAPPVTTTSTSSTTTSLVTAPGPTQTGIVSDCNKYAEAISGDSCHAFATRNGITDANLYAWNAVLGSSGQNCGTSLWAQEWYCVGIPGSAPTTSTSSRITTSIVGAPGPTQTGIVANCNKYAMAISGDSCDAFASRNGITDANLYAWNTVLGTNGANCGTSLWAQEYYCIGVSS